MKADCISLVCHAFDEHCDHFFHVHSDNAEPELMCDLAWLNHCWHSCQEDGDHVDDTLMEQLEFIEEAHGRLNELFHGMPSWIRYLDAYGGIHV